MGPGTSDRPAAGGGEPRFSFGANWARFLATIDESRVARAERALAGLLGTERLDGLSFLDAGSGSGLFSLAARRLGARVHSFDIDPGSVRCTRELRRRHDAGDPGWTVQEASLLDAAYLRSLGPFDVVYCWGVAHHTGALWDALDRVVLPVGPGGRLAVAVYNDGGRASVAWRRVKQAYCRLPAGLRFLVLGPAAAWLWGPSLLRDLLAGRPGASWRAHGRERGMSAWHDLVDWVGGYPYEVATAQAVIDFLAARGLALDRLVPAAGLANNQFVFRRPA
jgi:SAM-dependent methyltransferase